MTRPEPFSGSASAWEYTGTSTPKRGVRTVPPTSAVYRGSDGWQTTATQAGKSSGRVVSTICSPNFRR